MSNGLGDLFERAGSYFRQLWVKRKYIVIVPWLLAPACWYAVLQMPDEYETSARLYIDTDSIMRPLLRGLTVETDTSQQLNLMLQTLLSRPNVEKIARLSDLDLTTQTSADFRDLIEELQSEIKLSSSREQRNLYTVSYQHEDAQISKRVVESTISVLTENSLGEVRGDKDSARAFLARQIQEYAVRLREMENEQNRFRRENADVLALDNDGYVREIQDQKLRLAQEQQRLTEIEARLESAQLQLMDEIENPSPVVTANPVVGAGQYTTIFDERIAGLQAQMDSLLLRFTEAHPDVKELQRRLAELAQSRQDAIDELRQQAVATGEPELASPLFQVAKMSVNELEKEQASLRARIDALKASQQQLQENFIRYPELYSKLGTLERNYNINFEKYNELLLRQETAEFSDEVDTGTKTFEIRLIDPPQLPDEATYPPRGPFLGGITLLTVIIGAGVALLISQLNPVVMSGRDLSRFTGVPMLGSVSLNASPSEIRQQKKSSRRFWAASSGFIGLFIIVLVMQLTLNIHTRVPPVDVVFTELSDQVTRLVSAVRTRLL